jgi:transcriptional regulator with XRE-family HTH domain
MDFNFNRLKAERIARGKSQEQMALALGMAKSTYSKKENGVLRLSVDDFAKATSYLGMNTSEIHVFFTQKIPKREQEEQEVS